MIKLIIFDIGGVLIEESSRTPMYDNIAKYMGISEDAFEHARKPYWELATIGELSLKQLYELVLKKLNIHKKAEDVVKKHLEEYGKIECVRNKDIIRMIEELNINYDVVALTNTEKEIGEYNRKHGLFEFFERAFVSTELQMKKPDAEIYQAVLHACSALPEQAIFIDDKESYVAGAKTVGMHGIVYRNKVQLEEELRRYNIKI